jgi:hypothetical protein
MAEASTPASLTGAVAASLRAGRPLALVPPPREPARWTTLPGDDGRLERAERAWRERREALERELAGAAQALAVARDDERGLHEAIRAARADLRAARAARAADATSLALLAAELDAERIAHAVSRASAARLAADLAAARAELARRAEPAPPRPDLQRRAREQATAAGLRPAGDPGRLVADLDAAADALRRAAPPPTTEAIAVVGDPTPAAPGQLRLRRALVALARTDPLAAGRLLLGLLPAQGAVIEGPLSYDLTVRGLGTYAVTIQDGSAVLRRVAQARRRDEALFHLRAEPGALAELLAGERHRVRRFRGRVRATGQRRRAAELAPLAIAPLSLAAALRAGARLDPELVYALLPYAVAPEWTRGHAFTVAQEIAGLRTWFVTARDGAPLAVTTAARPADATVTMTRAGFDALLRGEPPIPQDRPAVRGDRAAVAALKAWTDRARGAA